MRRGAAEHGFSLCDQPMGKSVGHTFEAGVVRELGCHAATPESFESSGEPFFYFLEFGVAVCLEKII